MSPTTELTAPAGTSGSGPLCSPLRSWLGVVAVAFGTFSVVTTEMMPVGLLTSIGSALHVSDGTAGLAMTVPGIVAAVAAPLLTVGAARLDRRLVLTGLMGLLAAADLLSALAPGFPVLLVARVLVGVSIGGVWSIAAGLAVRLVRERSAGHATAVVFSGIAVASVLGVPAGTLIGDLIDWRAAFAVMAALSLAVATAMAVTLPRLPATEAVRLREVPGLFRNVRLRIGLITTLLLVTGQFCAYTYLRPVLEDVSGVRPGLISTLLLVYGVAGIAGNFLAGATAHRDPRRTLVAIFVPLAAAELLVPVTSGSPAGAAALLVLWGLAYGGVSVTSQTWVLHAAPDAREAASALFVGVFNVAIALGALLGGRVADGAGPTGVMWCGGALAVLALLNVAVFGGRGTGARTRPRA
ncbi:MFS transporter [Streptomyces sp. NA02950]|nr:MFS transporter [Streptomyces sp. NA02950]QKV92571.1 MFS transporter [Streptomyces sp. NA02950]